MKNKAKKFFKSIPAKIYLILGAIVIFSFFSNDFGLVDIQKTAVILAAGIDRGEEEGYTLTAQIAVPKGSDRKTGGTSSVELTGEGKTIAECVSQIYCRTGWVPKFVFCNLLLFGEDAAKENVFDALDYFLRNEYMPDSCFLAACKGTAKEVLSSESAVEDTSSLAITRLFSDATAKAGKAVKSTLKEFAIGYFGPSKSGCMPFVEPKEQEVANGTGQSGGGQSGSKQESSEGQKIYCAQHTALFHEGRMTGMLSGEETFALSLLKGTVSAGYFTAEEKGYPVSLNVIQDKGGASLKTKNGLKAEYAVKLTVKLFNRALPSEVEDIARSTLSPALLENAKETIQGYFEALVRLCKEANCDVFQLSRSLYRSDPKEYFARKEHFLETLSSEYKIELKSAK